MLWSSRFGRHAGRFLSGVRLALLSPDAIVRVCSFEEVARMRVRRHPRHLAAVAIAFAALVAAGCNNRNAVPPPVFPAGAATPTPVPSSTPSGGATGTP